MCRRPDVSPLIDLLLLATGARHAQRCPTFLGGYRFGLENAAYEQIRRAWAGRWVQQDVFVTRPFQQYLGPGHTGLVINCNVTPHFKGGLRQLGVMRAGAGRGEALQLADSLEDVWRDFVITGITETRRGIGPAGLPFRIAFQMTLRSTEVNRQGPQRLTGALFQFSLQAGQ